VPPARTELGFRLAVVSAAAPPTVRSTTSAVPLVTTVAMVEVPLLPWTMDRLAGFALIEKSFVTGAVIVNETVVG